MAMQRKPSTMHASTVVPEFVKGSRTVLSGGVTSRTSQRMRARGWTGVVVIAESHISVHTFPKRGFVSADVYTCKSGMDTKLIEQFFIDTFKLKKIETHFLKRGLEYPKENIY
jgi:S-adenosylmethionine/arginine decarboxylase-like enzyme